MRAQMYPEDFKQSAVKKMMNRGTRSVEHVAAEIGVSSASLYNWATGYGNSVAMKKDKRPQDRTGLERAALVIEHDKLKEHERGEFLRRNGLHSETIEAWREEIGKAFDSRKLTQAEKEEKLRDKKRIKELEKEINRKDRALAETTALLVLTKKVQALWGSSEEEE